MSFIERMKSEAEREQERRFQLDVDAENTGTQDPLLGQALEHFRLSVHAWSEAEYNRPRKLAAVVRQRSWRLAAGCALGCALLAGSVVGAVHERHQRQQLARIMQAARAAAAYRQQVAEQRARADDEDLLATVDSDISREVPSAMEPLAQLMAEDNAK